MLFTNSNNENNERRGDLEMENIEKLIEILQSVKEREEKEDKTTEEERNKMREGAKRLLEGCEFGLMVTDNGTFMVGSKLDLMFGFTNLLTELLYKGVMDEQDLTHCITFAIKTLVETKQNERGDE